MNKNTEKALELAVKKLVKVVEKTSNFTVEHAPDVLKEMITEAKISAAFTITTFSLILAACFVSMYYLIPKAFEGQYGNPGAGIVSIFSGFGAAGCVIALATTLYNLVVLKTCPKLFLLRQLKELVSKQNS